MYFMQSHWLPDIVHYLYLSQKQAYEDTIAKFLYSQDLFPPVLALQPDPN
jgi:hypothetical protein